MPYADITRREGLLAGACLRHGVGNPYADFELTLERQRRVQAYEKAVQGAYFILTVPHHGHYRDAWGVEWHVVRHTDALDRLEEAATSGNEVVFTQVLREIDWNNRSAKDYIRAIDLALQAGAHLPARKLAAQGAEFHFDNEELQKYARILAPPQLVNLQPSSPVSPRANVRWLKEHKADFKGKWVALKDGDLLASADTHDELMAAIGETKRRGILVTNLY